MLTDGIFIDDGCSLKDALRLLDQTSEKVLLIVADEKKLMGTISDGDIRRALLAGKDLSSTVDGVYNKKPISMSVDEYTFDSAKQLLLKNRITLLPILEDGKVINYVTWDKLFSGSLPADESVPMLDVPVIIMAGGKGTRLEPFTKILPKPLIPVNEKPIIEMIINEFQSSGVKDFSVIVNYKGEMIQAYFGYVDKDYNLDFVWEKNFCGTAGGLTLIKDKVKDTFIVSNCDVIVKAKYDEVVAHHKAEKASMTILSSIQHYKIPYGVVDFKEGGEVMEIKEKPEFSFTINTGVYVIEKSALDYIPENENYDMPTLIKELIRDGKKVLTYPVNENEYVDIGQWDEYRQAVSKLQIIK